jgi:hypothetical protein
MRTPLLMHGYTLTSYCVCCVTPAVHTHVYTHILITACWALEMTMTLVVLVVVLKSSHD